MAPWPSLVRRAALILLPVEGLTLKKAAKGYHCFFVGDLVLPERNGSASQAWGSLGLRFAVLFAVFSEKGRRSDERVCLAFSFADFVAIRAPELGPRPPLKDRASTLL